MYFAGMSESPSQLANATAVVRNAIGTRRPVVGLILGSGLGVIAQAAQNQVIIPYGNIPGFHVSKVKGHAGQLIIGEIEEITIIIMQGRFHYYEGVSMEEIAFPIELMERLGVRSVIITSASGGVNPQFQKGDIMVLDDHINFVFRNPLRQTHKVADRKGNSENAFGHMPHVNSIYNKDLKELAVKATKAENIDLKRGVYLMVEGPSYETQAEIKMVRKLGGDVVGMSTVPEAIAANQRGMSVLGITYVSNMASGMAPGPLVHSHVIETMEMIREDMLKLVTRIIKGI